MSELLSIGKFNIQVENLPEQVNESHLVNFLKQKTHLNFVYTDFHTAIASAPNVATTGVSAFFIVSSNQVAEKLISLSGIYYAGKKLQIHLEMIATSQFNTQSIFFEYIHRNYDPISSALKLEGLNHPKSILRSANISLDLNKDSQLFDFLLSAIEKVTGSKILTISLANNRIYSLETITKRLLALISPEIIHLNLERNDLELQSLQPLSVALGHQLRELILSRNPVSTFPTRKMSNDPRSPVPKLISQYQCFVLQKFPNLFSLDKVSVPPIEMKFGIAPLVLSSPTFAINSSVAIPREFPATFFDQPQSRDLLTQFLTGYFCMFDNKENRSTVTQLYVNDSILRLSIHHLDRKPCFWVSKRGIFRGNDAISIQFNELPSLVHDLRTFRVDGWQMEGAMMCCFSGILADPIERKFQRNFLLIPAPPSSIAAQRGSPAVIINDFWTVIA